MALPPLDPGSRVADRAFEAIHAAILDGDLPPGAPLRIRSLADELGTSMMPVREAIRRLEEQGLIVSSPYRGAVVRGFTPGEMLDVYAVRRLLEVEAARLGASDAEREETAFRMEESYGAARRALGEVRAAEYLARDEEMLETLYAASRNLVLVSSIRALWHRSRAYKLVGVRESVDAGESAALLDYQPALIAAVRCGDGARAAEVTASAIDAAIARIGGALTEAG
ncbi:GntR family transcriptional regulator [Microbacterium sp. gxy059]|uniref:GntR family transcriptional regulator n=1 Tax=Microbacterium sp. gxy059 TaxID=2957199 RepID=UPI003D980EA2